MAILNPFENRRITSPTGASLAVYLMRAPSTPRAIIQINHGMAEHGERYARFATELTRNCYHVIVHDQRGHGLTTAPDAPQGVFAPSDGMDRVMEDISHVQSFAHNEFGKLPVIMFGHSMGSILTLVWCLRNPDAPAAMAIWNSGVDTGFLAMVFKGLLKVERMFKGSDVPSAIANKLTFDDWNKKFAPNRTDFDWLSRDEAEVDKYCDDPHCGFPVSTSMWLDVLQAIYEGADDNRLNKLPKQLPVHMVAGEKDPCSDYGKAVERLHSRMRKTGMTDLELSILHETRHESLNEINRDETSAAFVEWLGARF